MINTIDLAFSGTLEIFIGIDIFSPPLFSHAYFFGILSPSLNAGDVISIALQLKDNNISVDKKYLMII